MDTPEQGAQVADKVTAEPSAWLTIAQCAAELGVASRTIRRAIARGALKAARTGGDGPTGNIRVRREWLDSFVEDQMVKPTVQETA